MPSAPPRAPHRPRAPCTPAPLRESASRQPRPHPASLERRATDLILRVWEMYARAAFYGCPRYFPVPKMTLLLTKLRCSRDRPGACAGPLRRRSDGSMQKRKQIQKQVLRACNNINRQPNRRRNIASHVRCQCRKIMTNLQILKTLQIIRN